MRLFSYSDWMIDWMTDWPVSPFPLCRPAIQCALRPVPVRWQIISRVSGFSLQFNASLTDEQSEVDRGTIVIVRTVSYLQTHETLRWSTNEIDVKPTDRGLEGRRGGGGRLQTIGQRWVIRREIFWGGSGWWSDKIKICFPIRQRVLFSFGT